MKDKFAFRAKNEEILKQPSAKGNAITHAQKIIRREPISYLYFPFIYLKLHASALYRKFTVLI